MQVVLLVPLITMMTSHILVTSASHNLPCLRNGYYTTDGSNPNVVIVNCYPGYETSTTEMQCHGDGWSDGAGCTAVCSDPLVSGPDGVDDSKITASSTFIVMGTEPKYGRLNSYGGWFASPSDSSPYIQVEFSTMRTVHFIQTQGGNLFSDWVIDYNVAYSVDCSSFDVVTDNGGGTKTFPGNADMNTVVTNVISPPIQARCIRVQPLAFTYFCALRFEVLGCE